MNERAISAQDLLAAVRARTPARLLAGRAGPAYRTATPLDLRRDHAAARDAVGAELELERDLGPQLIADFDLFGVQTRAPSKSDYLLRPDLGRRLDDDSRVALTRECLIGCDLQVVIG